MNDNLNKRVVLARHPAGAVATADLAIATAPPSPVSEGSFLVKNHWLSIDPMIRLFIDKEPMGAIPTMPLGSVIPGAAVGTITESLHPDFAVGDIVEGRFGWQSFAVSNGAGVTRVDPADGPIEQALGVFGLPGFSAYAGLDVAGGVTNGQTVLISGGAGAVGSAAGALAASRGARVVGIASGAAKREWLINEIGYDAVVDRTAPGFEQALANALPNGIDLYFDNVGGPMIMQVLPLMSRNGCILICGLMAQYGGSPSGSTNQLPSFLEGIMAKTLSVRSFVNLAHEQLRPAFKTEMKQLVTRRPALNTIHVTEGIDQTPVAFEQLFAKGVTGKRLVRV